MPTNTSKTFLMVKSATGDKYEKLLDIKDYPDIGSGPEMLEWTTLTHLSQVYLPGLEKVDALEFKANFENADLTKIEAMAGKEQDLALWFGGTVAGDTVTPDGSDGKWTFKGYVVTVVNGGATNEVRGMTVKVAPTTRLVHVTE